MVLRVASWIVLSLTTLLSVRDYVPVQNLTKGTREMTSEQRLDRVERILKLFVSAGFRARDVHAIDEKLNILISNQIRSDERFEEKFQKLVAAQTKLAKAQALSDRKFADLAEAQALSDRKLAELIDIIRKDRNGNRSSRNN